MGAVVLVGAPAVPTNPYLICNAFCLGGVGVSIWNVITVSLRQQITPGRLRGRVNGAYRLVAWGTMSIRPPIRLDSRNILAHDLFN